jgi:tetratricopeptide (TPR) repeat protein
MASFVELRRLPPGESVLVSGVDTPLNPWIEPDFLKQEFGPHEWTVVTPFDRPDTDLPPVRPSVHFRHAAEVIPAAFDHAFVYDAAGNLRHQYDRAALAASAQAQPEAIVVPELAPLVDRLRSAPDDHMALLKAGELCLSWGLDQQAEGYLGRSVEVTHGHDPYAFFFLGELKERQHDLAAAYTDYQRAIETDQEPRNPLFQQAVDRLRAARH